MSSLPSQTGAAATKEVLYKQSAKEVANKITDAIGVWFQLNDTRLLVVPKTSELEYNAISLNPNKVVILHELDAKLAAIRSNRGFDKRFELYLLKFELDRDPVIMHIHCSHRFFNRKRVKDNTTTDVSEERATKRQRTDDNKSSSSTDLKEYRDVEIKKLRSQKVMTTLQGFFDGDGKEHEMERKLFIPLVDRLGWLQQDMTPIDVQVFFNAPSSRERILRASGYTAITHDEMTVYSQFALGWMKPTHPDIRIETKLEFKTKTLVVTFHLF